MQRYGNSNEAGYPIAAWIWGHRLRIGQHWMEYLLEFLNVLAGFDYELGQGVSEGTQNPSPRLQYRQFARLGLRRFIFYDARDKHNNPIDDRARELLLSALEQKAASAADDPLPLARNLLSAFSAVEEARSWYAKSLFPAHENLLFWQGDQDTSPHNPNKQLGKKSRPKLSEIDDLGKQFGFDRTVTFSKRNFFARGGEIYYLILSAGTEGNLQRRQFIATRLNALLTQNNQSIGLLAQMISDTWEQIITNTNQSRHTNGFTEVRMGAWIPDPGCILYAIITEDLEMFLRSELDTLEMLDLLAHLINFHLVLHIYHRAHPHAIEAQHGSDCVATCRPTLLIDAIGHTGDNVVRGVSAALFREQEQYQVHMCRKYILFRLQNIATKINGQDYVVHLSREMEQQFSSSLRGSKHKFYERKLNDLQRKFTDGKLDETGYLGGYADLLLEFFSEDFRKSFLGVHRKLAKAIGFVAPNSGPSARYVLGDNLLKALVMANIQSGQSITYTEFLTRIYQRYGLIVGLAEARDSGLFSRQRIDAEYYERNREALLQQLQRAGLAVAYSDATAMIGLQ